MLIMSFAGKAREFRVWLSAWRRTIDPEGRTALFRRWVH